jgi:hypothetical protein
VAPVLMYLFFHEFSKKKSTMHHPYKYTSKIEWVNDGLLLIWWKFENNKYLLYFSTGQSLTYAHFLYLFGIFASDVVQTYLNCWFFFSEIFILFHTFEFNVNCGYHIKSDHELIWSRENVQILIAANYLTLSWYRSNLGNSKKNLKKNIFYELVNR